MNQAATFMTTKSHPVPGSTSHRPQRSPEKSKAPDPKQTFVATALDMSWKLAVVVLVPVIIGVQLDKLFGTSFITFIGLALALAGSGVVMWRAMQAANRIPVPKLTEKQKRDIRKSYEEEDND